jgi:porin
MMNSVFLMRRRFFRQLRLLPALTLLFVGSVLGGRALGDESAPTTSGTTTNSSDQSALMRFLTQDYLLGNWGGWRPKLSEKGVDFEFFYVGAMPSNLSGGIQRGTVFEGVLAMTLDVDTGKLFDFPNGHFHAGSLYIHGDRFSPNYVGDLNVVSLIDFPGAFRLWELWYEHKFFNQHLSVKAGELALDQDFLVPEYSKTFLNQTFFFPTLAFDVWDQPSVYPIGYHSLASTPYGAPGIRVRYDATDSIYAQAGVYDGNPDRSYHGTRINLNQDEGALSYFEVGYKLNQGTNSTGLPGAYKLGAFLHTDDFYDNYRDANGDFYLLSGNPQRTHPYDYGFYFLADQMLYRETTPADPAKQGLGGFFRLTGAPEDRNLVSFGVDSGLVYKGLIPTRDWDSFGVAASYLGVSGDLRRAIHDAQDLGVPNLTVPDYEAVLETTYKAQITPWWTLQPSFQWVMHPGGSKALPDALVFILQTTLRF